jgi:hypothetical protein
MSNSGKTSRTVTIAGIIKYLFYGRGIGEPSP